MKKIFALSTAVASLVLPMSAYALEFNSPIPATTIPELANIIVRAVLAGASVVAFLSFIWAGWLWFYSRGDATLITKSKNIMIWAIFGLVAILLSFAAVNTILGAVGAS
ncbi:MAG: hypothetical protein KBB55_00265 [Candidatus Buchananbacteria bacterium]|nr:hypothetical protein [Candidatus Buchananbacteria bacterium]